MRVIKPPRLRAGDLIGLVAPAGPVTDRSRVEGGVRYLESRGYRVRMGRHALKMHGYWAGSDAERIEDLHAMFQDQEVKGIFCLRGGYGTSRLLSRLDYALIARHPKILLGFSDITALQLALWTKCRLVTFHGPMVHADMHDGMNAFTESKLWALLEEPKQLALCEGEGLVLQNKPASGRLLGGNLSLVITLLGTPFLPQLSRALLFLEDVAEEPFRVDRMLTQLGNCGIWDRLHGLLFGQLTHCQPREQSRPSFTIEQILADLAQAIQKPVVCNLPFGHVERKITLPVGIRARWHPETRQLHMLETAVV
jgi:muramoyltetrapeptide carboxypeptidase